ncbi:MAG: response regulator [Candidatus Hodarchaeota archaeon]
MPQSAKIMIVDDISFVRLVLRELLEKKGLYTIVAEAKDGKEAVSLHLKHNPDLCLMDLAMPVLNGVEATRCIRNTNPTARIIVLSGIDNRAGITQALAAGAVDFLAKPIDPDLLLTTVERHLSAEDSLGESKLDEREMTISLASSFLSELLRHSISPLNGQIRQIVNEVRSELAVAMIDLRNFFNDLQERIATRLTHELAADLMQEAFQTFYAKYKQQIESIESFFPKTLWRMGAYAKYKQQIDNAETPTTLPLPDQAQFDAGDIWFVTYKLAKTGPEVVSAQEGDIPVKDELDMMGWHLKAGLVFLTALGQGNEYHTGLFGPFPVPASREHAALVCAAILPDVKADDPRMPGRSYTVLGLFYPRILEGILPDRDLLTDAFTDFLQEIKEMSELDKEKLDKLRGQLFTLR